MMTERSGGYRGLARGLAVIAIAGTVLAGLMGCSAHPATLPQASCGEATTHNLSSETQVLNAGKGALSCFAAAARQCRNGSIAITEMGVDTGTNYVFAVAPAKSGCQATEWSQFYSANNGGSQGGVVVTQCSETPGPAGVTLACAGQKILIPLTVTTPATLTNP